MFSLKGELLLHNQFLISSKDNGCIVFDISCKPPNRFPTSSAALQEIKLKKENQKNIKYILSCFNVCQLLMKDVIIEL